ncbi:nuclear transport factor 2 family protein [Ekhidna sp.]
MRSQLIVLILAISFLVGCSPKKTSNESQSPDVREEVENDQGDETLSIAMDFMDAMGKGDMERMISLMHDDMVWHNEGDASMPWIGPWKGKQAILEEFMPLFGKNFKTTKWNTEDAFASGDTAAFFGRMVGLLTSSNQETKEFTFALRVKVKDGKIILWNWFEDSYEVSNKYHGV